MHLAPQNVPRAIVSTLGNKVFVLSFIQTKHNMRISDVSFQATIKTLKLQINGEK